MIHPLLPLAFYRFPDPLMARPILQLKYGRQDWYQWLALNIPFEVGSTVADVGCGDGAFWATALQFIPKDLTLRLFDIDAASIDRATDLLGRIGIFGDWQAAVASAEHLPIQRASVNVTLAFNVLHQLEDPLCAIREFTRITRPGGTIAISANPTSSMSEISTVFDKSLGKHRNKKMHRFGSEDATRLCKLLFDDVSVLEYNDDLVITDPIDILGYMISMPACSSKGIMNSIAEHVEFHFENNEHFSVKKSDHLILAKMAT